MPYVSRPRHTAGLFVGLVLCLTNSFGNSRHLVRAQQGNLNPYEVVFASEAEDTTSAPGIYALSTTRAPRLVVAGNVLGAGDAFSGVLSMLDLTRYTDRHEGVAVVDGKLVVFSNRTVASNPKSSIVVSSGKAPLLDLLTRERVELPPITSLDALTVLDVGNRRDSDYHAQVLLFSLRHPSHLGSGITFVVTVEKPEGKSAELKQLTPCYVLDYEFLDKNELNRLMNPGSQLGVFSRRLLRNQEIPRGTDIPMVTRWRSDVASYARLLAPGASRAREQVLRLGKEHPRMPFFWLPDESIRLATPPEATLLQEPFTIEQLFNPLSGLATMRLSAARQRGTESSYQGTLDFLDNGEPVAFSFTDTREADHSAVIASRSERLWAVLVNGKNGSRAEMVELGIDFPKTLKKEVSVTQRLHGDGMHYLLLSVQGATREPFTDCFVFSEGHGRLNLERRIPILKKFLSQRELEARIWTPDQEDRKDETANTLAANAVLFDNITPVTRGRRYPPRPLRTTPYLDLTTSTATTAAQAYLRTLRSREISQFVQYREFDLRGATTPRTGLYATLGPGEPTFVPGQLLVRTGRKPVLDRETVPGTDISPAVELELVAMAKDVTGRTSRDFQLALLARTEDQRYQGVVGIVTLPARFENFRGAKIVLGRRKHHHQINVLSFLDSGGETGRPIDRSGGVHCSQFNLTLDNSTTPRHLILKAGEAPGWLERQVIPINTLKERLVPDVEGQWYWIADPSIERTSAQFAIRSLTAPETRVFPHRRGSERRIKWEESLKTDWNEFLGGSDWLLYSTFTLRNNYPAIDKLIKAREEKPEEEPLAHLFPGLDGVLEQVASGDPAFTRPLVFLVDGPLQQKLFQRMFLRLATNPGGQWSVEGRQARDFYVYDIPKGTSKEQVADEMDKILRENRSLGRRAVVIGTLDRLIPADALAKLRQAAVRETTAAAAADGQDPGTNEAGDPQIEDPAEEEGEEENPETPRRVAGRRAEAAVEETADAETGGGDAERARQRNVRSSALMLLTTGGADVGVSSLPRTVLPPNVTPILIATPAEWRLAQELEGEKTREALRSRYQVVPNCLSSSWTLWPPTSELATKATKTLHRSPVSREEHQVFPLLNELLTGMTARGQAARHRILLVPDEIKPLVERLILSRWASDSNSVDGPWNYRNHDLSLFQVSRVIGDKQTEIRQSDVLDNFDSMREIATQRQVVLLGRLDEVTRIGRAINADSTPTFKIRDHATRTSGSATLGTAVRDEDRQRPPHLLWWLATEGRRIQPQQWERSQPAPQIHSLLVGSERDWATLNGEADWENRFGLNRHFEVVRLDTPTLLRREELIHSLLERNEIQKLGYEFRLDELGGTEAKRQLVSLIVNRTNQIARQYGIDETAAFIRVYTELSRCLTQDMTLRQERRVSRYFVESIFSRIFPIPVALSSLPQTDYLHRLHDPVRAGIAMQQMGYNSPIDLKLKVIRTIMSQTHGTSPGRPIPSSTILFGGTSTGKTFFFETLMRYLGLKSYNPDVSENEEAEYYIVKVGNLYETDDPAHPENRSVDAELKNISDFLSQPKGHRGFLLFDDLHKAKSTPIYRKLMAFIESLYEAKDGYVVATRKQGDERREIPVRNLNVFLTINPTRNREILDQYDADKDLTGRVLAALARADYSVEDSFLARFTTIVDMSEFPTEAKAPALVQQLRRTSEEEYRADPRLVLVTPDLLGRVVSGNRDANAREFLTAATQNLLHIDPDQPTAALYLASATPTVGHLPPFGETRTDKIEAFVRGNRILRPVLDKSYETQVEFLRLIMDAFRMHVYHALLQGTRREPRLTADPEIRRNVLVPLFLVAAGHIEERRRLPVSMVQIHPEDFGGLESDEITWLLRLIDRFHQDEKNFFPVAFGPNFSRDLPRLGDFVRGISTASRDYTRVDVLSHYSRQVFQLLLPLFQSYFRVSSTTTLPTMRDWFEQLNGEDPKALQIAVGDNLSKLFLEMGTTLFDPRLVEMGREGQPSLTTFDQARLLYYVIDRAIVEFPWARLSRFLHQAVTAASKDLSFGQKEAFQNYTFRNGFSPFNPITVDTLHQALDTLSERGTLRPPPGQYGQEGAGSFADRCKVLIAGQGVGE